MNKTPDGGQAQSGVEKVEAVVVSASLFSLIRSRFSTFTPFESRLLDYVERSRRISPCAPLAVYPQRALGRLMMGTRP
jgi:hypothetical protein